MKASVYKIEIPRRRFVNRGNERRLVTPHPRRRVLSLAAGAAALSAISRVAWAQPYPTRPVRIIVPFAPGGSTDISARLLGQWLSERLGQQFVIENRPGASGNIGTEAVVRAPADGHTLLGISTVNVVNTVLFDKLNFNFIRDIAPVAGIFRFAFVMVVNPSFPAKTVPEFITYANANPGKISFASSGAGTGLHMSGELFKMMTGVNMVHIPYRGSGPALTDLLGGQVQVMFVDLPSSIEYVRSGKLRALAVTTAMRSEVLPNIPTVAEFLPGYVSSGWQGIGAPRNTPAEIVERLNKEINAALADPKMKVRFAELGGVPFSGSPAELEKVVVEEAEKWGKVIRSANIKPE